MTQPVRLAAYALTAVLLAAYAVVMWWVVHPDVPANYRAYYIDQTTTCLDQPVPGTYTLGTIVSFRPDGADAARLLKACGWEGPTGDGTHAVGTSSRLRFDWAQPASKPLELSLDLVAITHNGELLPQTVDVIVNDLTLASLEVASADPQHFDIPLPAGLVGQGRAEVVLEFPTAVQMGATDPSTRWRSVKLLAAGISPIT
jgi:hypothetical protein